MPDLKIRNKKTGKIIILRKKTAPVQEPQNRLSQAWETWKNLPPIKAGDELVERVAKNIEPTVPAGISTQELMAKHLVPQMASEFIRGYRPSTFLPAMGASKVLKHAAVPAAKIIGKKVSPAIPLKVKKMWAKYMTVGKGRPDEFNEKLKDLHLKNAAAERQGEYVLKTLSTAPKDIVIKTPKGNTITVKAGKPLTQEHQNYLGRIFRKDINLGGLQSRMVEPAEVTARINKNIEIEMAFNPRIQFLKRKLEAISNTLRNKELQAKGMIGRTFETPTGGVEKVVGMKTRGADLITSEIKPPIITQAPAMFSKTGQVTRATKQVAKMPTIEGMENLSRQQLLIAERIFKRQLIKESIKIHDKVEISHRIFDRTFAEQIRLNPRYKELSAIAQEGRGLMDKWSRELVKSGIPKEAAEEAITKNIGEYMPRMFEKYLKKGLAVEFYGKNQLRLRLDGLRHKKDLSFAVLKELGEKKAPALPVAIRTTGIQKSINTNEFFKFIAKNSEWVSKANTTGAMIPIPKSASFGALSGKFVVPEIAEDIIGTVAYTRPGTAARIYNRFYTTWKMFKVVWNPGAQGRNVMGNSILTDLEGTNHFTQSRLLPKAILEMKRQGKIYQSAVEHGAIGNEFIGGDIKLIEKYYSQVKGSNLDKVANLLKIPGNVYQSIEQTFKLTKFMHMLEQGKTPAVAALGAQKALFNYSEIPKFIEFAKKAFPFVTFTYKAIPNVARAIVNRPLAVYKYYALFNGVNEMSRKFLNLSPEEYAREKDALPPWMIQSIGGMPGNLLMPYRDTHGRAQWLNLEYILPIGMAPEAMKQSPLELVGNPILTLFADLSKNQDFRGHPIVPAMATPDEAAKFTTEYIYRQIMPTITPGLPGLKGGYSWEKLMDAFFKRPDVVGRLREIEPVLLDVLMGLKITPVDRAQSEMFQAKEKSELLRDLMYQAVKLNHPGISEEHRDTEMEKIFKKINRLMK